MKQNFPETNQSEQSGLLRVFTGLFGLFLGLTLVKFGNPVIMGKYFILPQNIYEWIFDSWPEKIGYWLLAGLMVIGLLVARWKMVLPKLLVAMPLLWLVWEIIAATQSSALLLSRSTVMHFGGAVVCFYLGLFALGRVAKPTWFWLGILAGFAIVIVSGFQQHFGGLEQTRKYWMVYVYPTLKEIPPGFMKKMSSNRIFGTLFYPNTLAGVILLLLPIMLAFFWSIRERFTAGARLFLMGIGALGALACLYWSGSKGGWLIMLLVGLMTGMCLPLKKRTKVVLAVVILVMGLSGFFIKYFVFFEKGATSVVARFDYWQAALQTVREKPVFGTGPGTFGKAYEELKRPESEMAQLAHNDYLQQASDSGVLGFLTFATMVIGTLIYTWRKARLHDDRVRLAVWLGLFGWAIQSLFEFGLYIPALGWTAFALMGWLLAQSGFQIDSRKTAG